ncbi:uncharacterized protein LOC129951380 [Eupeodes corollae]|uniref:uncharacterized protein LOC129951380 n=1 Tax=Eupeodes corollae TaxID=290404 RepID=UPI0024906C18|nr:uncharacterized protein LOC129951380 [Eupeodes corollae]
MFEKILIFSTLLSVSLAELPSFGPYATSGWRPQGPSFGLPNEYFAVQAAQRAPRVELEITKERVDYAGQLTEANAPQISPNYAYLPPDEIDETLGVDVVQVQGLPNKPGVQFNRFKAPFLNTREYYPYRRISQFRRPQQFSGKTKIINSNSQQFSPVKFPSTQYGIPVVDQPSDTSENQANGYTFPLPEEPFNEGSEQIVEGSVTKGEYFVLTPEKTLQKVSYKTSQTEEEARTNAFTAELKYTPVDKIEGPLYKYNDQGQLVRIYKK